PGVSIIIDPIVSLIDDQIENLEMVGIGRNIGITGQTDEKRKAIELLTRGEYLFCYIAPERFQTKQFREAMRALTVAIPVSLIAIDEAHCVSEWGHDFRTSYLNIGRTSRVYSTVDSSVPPLLTLTGTASRIVLRDVMTELQIGEFESVITPKNFDRKELNFSIRKISPHEKFDVLKGILTNLIPGKFGQSNQTFYQNRGDSTPCGLVFCPHVNGEHGVVHISSEIKKHINVTVDYYSGTVPKNVRNVDYNSKKRLTAYRFKTNKLQLLVATKAFGMGIDKPNIRFIIHYGIPGSIEAFYQEAGRAGRDREKSYCIIIFSEADPERNKFLLDPSNDIETVRERYEKITTNEEKDDITRALYFHFQAFKGMDKEIEKIKEVLKRLQGIGQRKKATFVVNVGERNDFEKALHRLLILGVVEDYTIDYSADEFTVYIANPSKETIYEAYGDYISEYHRGRMVEELNKAQLLMDQEYEDFVIEMCRLLITFIYETIEKSRRRALNEMVALCRDNQLDEEIRKRILAYLQTEYSECLEKLLGNDNCGVNEMKNIVENIRSTKDANSIRGVTVRYLESIPDHPGLLFLRSIVEAYTGEKDSTIIEQNFNAAIANALKKYNLGKEVVYNTIGWGLSMIAKHNNFLSFKILQELINKIDDDDFLKILMLSLDRKMNDYIALRMLTRLSQSLISTFEGGY
ncbi:MAG: helicase-related protein, partial [Dysgonamonadaceae bacterium]|nr:helicase-related protein [Dysgonamonadaceae bacterium]